MSTDALPADRPAGDVLVDVGVVVHRHEAECAQCVRETRGPVIAPLLPVGLVRVVEIEISGMGHHHLEVNES